VNEVFSGRFSKMRANPGNPVQYSLHYEDQQLDMNTLLGKTLRVEYGQQIRCCHCQRVTKKSFNQGYCYPCFQKLAQCDRCIMSPELCHFAAGTCREPEWGETHCMQPHIVYLANSSGLKVGITRQTQVPTRWIDQGAIQALPVLSVSSRHLSGLAEDLFREWLPDRTNWRKLLKNEIEAVDLLAEREALQMKAKEGIEQLRARFPDESIEWLIETPVDFEYPSLAWLEKAKTYNLDKTPVIEDRLIAIRGQYLILEQAALNVRKFTSYDVKISVLES